MENWLLLLFFVVGGQFARGILVLLEISGEYSGRYAVLPKMAALLPKDCAINRVPRCFKSLRRVSLARNAVKLILKSDSLPLYFRLRLDRQPGFQKKGCRKLHVVFALKGNRFLITTVV